MNAFLKNNAQYIFSFFLLDPFDFIKVRATTFSISPFSLYISHHTNAGLSFFLKQTALNANGGLVDLLHLCCLTL